MGAGHREPPTEKHVIFLTLRGIKEREIITFLPLIAIMEIKMRDAVLYCPARSN